ncbi:polysaccharide deacetylase family protein [Candidatus Bathyarchaeota archaeon]|nr:polysaccharide deacetylase family protein [Candidatus Bathyarchaeota archaeon]
MLAITVDVEDWYHIPSITGSPFSRFKDIDDFFKKWSGRYDYLTVPTNRTLSIFDEFNIKATFFVVADVTEHYPGLVEKIAQKGHEVACHGLHHACKINPGTKEPLMSQQEFEERTTKAKEMLEKASGVEVVGYRAPNAYIAGWMLDCLERIGFKYDSSVSLNSFYNKSDSQLKRVDTKPYYPERGSLEPGEKREILEIPWPYFKFGPRFPTGGGPALRFLGARYIMMGLKQSLKKGDTLVYFHPIDISNDKFPSRFSFKRPFYWAIKGHLVENKIKHILTDAQFDKGTCRDIVTKYL